MNTLEETLSHGNLLTRTSGRFHHECQELGSVFCLSLSRWSWYLLSGHTEWKEHWFWKARYFSYHLATWLWFVVEEEGKGETEKTEMVRSLTSAHGKDVSGVLHGAMSSQGTTGNTQVQSPLSATTATGVSPGLTILLSI